MKILFTAILAIAIMVMLGTIFPATQAYANGLTSSRTDDVTTNVPGSWIVQLENIEVDIDAKVRGGDAIKTKINKVAQQVAAEAQVAENLGIGEVTHRWNSTAYGYVITNVQNPIELLKLLAADSNIKQIYPDGMYHTFAQYYPNDANRIDSDRMASLPYKPDRRGANANIDVAIIDQGVSAKHPDLNVMSTRCFITTTNNCGPGSHGTHVAGICCAKDNLNGVVGIAPGARIWGMQACLINIPSTSGTCSISATISAMDFIRTQGGYEVVNLSLGGCGGTTAFAGSAQDVAMTALWNSGVTVVVAAGNNGVNVESNNCAYCLNTSAICVSAFNDSDGKCGGAGPSVRLINPRTGQQADYLDDRFSFFSNFGTSPDIMAPGVSVLSTWTEAGYRTYSDQPFDPLTEAQIPRAGTSKLGGYHVNTGTSMSAPIVSGAVAILKAKNPAWTPATVKSNLQSLALPQSQACDGFGGGGIIAQSGITPGAEKVLYLRNY